MSLRGSVVRKYKRFRFTLLVAIILIVSVLAYPVIPASQAVNPADFDKRSVDVPTATVAVYFENPIAMSLFDADKAERYVNSRFTTQIQVEKRGMAGYEDFSTMEMESDTVYALFTNWNVVSWDNGHEYTGLAVPEYDIFFVAGHSAFKMVDGQYLVFAHEVGHLLEGPEHNPQTGYLMSEPIGGDQVCECSASPYAKWAR